jgi:hypothetical protein
VKKKPGIGLGLKVRREFSGADSRQGMLFPRRLEFSCLLFLLLLLFVRGVVLVCLLLSSASHVALPNLYISVFFCVLWL